MCKLVLCEKLISRLPNFESQSQKELEDDPTSTFTARRQHCSKTQPKSKEELWHPRAEKAGKAQDSTSKSNKKNGGDLSLYANKEQNKVQAKLKA